MKTNVFKKAHEITKQIIKKGDSYKATFALALKFVYSQIKKEMNKLVELKGTEKQVKWADDIRNRMIRINEIFKETTKDTDMTNVNDETLEGMILKRIERAQNAFRNILNNDESKFFIDNFRNIKDYMIDNLEEREDRAKYICALVSAY